MGLVFVSIKEICLYPYKYVLFSGFLDPVLKMERCALCLTLLLSQCGFLNVTSVKRR